VNRSSPCPNCGRPKKLESTQCLACYQEGRKAKAGMKVEPRPPVVVPDPTPRLPSRFKTWVRHVLVDGKWEPE